MAIQLIDELEGSIYFKHSYGHSEGRAISDRTPVENSDFSCVSRRLGSIKRMTQLEHVQQGLLVPRPLSYVGFELFVPLFLTHSVPLACSLFVLLIALSPPLPSHHAAFALSLSLPPSLCYLVPACKNDTENTVGHDVTRASRFSSKGLFTTLRHVP